METEKKQTCCKVEHLWDELATSMSMRDELRKNIMQLTVNLHFVKAHMLTMCYCKHIVKYSGKIVIFCIFF